MIGLNRTRSGTTAKAMPKQAKISRIKAFHTYTIQEAADIAGVSTHTINNWGKNGLRMMDAVRPTLIRGDDLRGYIKAQRNKRKSPTDPDTFYCVACRQARNAAENMADCTIIGNRATLTALCATCETIVSKPVAKANVTALARTLDLTIKRHEATL